MFREEHIKSRQKSESIKGCKRGVKEIWPPIAIMHSYELHSTSYPLIPISIVAGHELKVYYVVHHRCIIHSASCSQALVSGPASKMPASEVDLYGGQPIGPTRLLPLKRSPFMTSTWSRTCATDAAIQADVHMTSMMAQIISYAPLLYDRRDLTLLGRASLNVVSCRLCQSSFVALVSAPTC